MTKCKCTPSMVSCRPRSYGGSPELTHPASLQYCTRWAATPPPPPPHTSPPLDGAGGCQRRWRGLSGCRRSLSKTGCGAMLASFQLHPAIQQQLPAGTAVLEPALWDVSGPERRALAPLHPSASRQLFLLDCDEGQVPSRLGCRVRMLGVNSPPQCGQGAAR